jgi:hypothetical protein
MYRSSGKEGGSSKSLLAEFQLQSMNGLCIVHGLGMPREEIAFTAQPKINSQSQIFILFVNVASDGMQMKWELE